MKLVYLFPIVFFLSCSRQEVFSNQICGLATQGSFVVHNSDEFWTLSSNIKSENFSCEGIYSWDVEAIHPRYFTYSVYSLLKNVCNSDVPNIEFSVKLINPDPNLQIYGLFNDTFLIVNSPQYLPLSSTDGINFYGNVDFHFVKTYGVSKEFFTSLNIRSITKGVLSADSAYVFSNLSSMSCSIKAHKPQ